jgi:hypothetical protein
VCPFSCCGRADVWAKGTDVIVMKNGDHLTGESKKVNQGVLYTA